jgi:5'-nucleotidase/UDP-sugar diphosphatase
MRKSHQILLFPALLLFGFGSSQTLGQSQKPELAPLTILHWNDFHARNVPYKIVVRDTAKETDSVYYVAGSGNFLGYIKHYKDDRKDVAVMNAGDDFQGTPISSITFGRSQIELMNIINPDAMTLGNHEFDYGLENLENDLKLAQFPIVNANLFDKRSGRNFLPPYLVKSYGKVRVGIIGLIAPDLPILTMKDNIEGLEMLNHVQVIRKYVGELKKEKVNLIIVLSHIGVDVDEVLADSVPDISVIVGGHSHTPLFKPVKRNRTVICQAGSYGRWLGKLDLMVDLNGDSVYSYKGKLIETVVGKVRPDSLAEAKANELEKMVSKELSEVIGTLETDWVRKFTEECNIGSWSADVMRDFAKTDIAFMNSGTIRKDLYAGDITVRDIWEIFPFNNHFETFRVSGKTLREMIEWQAAGKGELMQVSGIRYKYDSTKPFGQKVVSIEVGGLPLDDNRTYSVVTNNYVAGHIEDFFGISPKGLELTRLNKLDHDLFIEAVRKQKNIASKVEGRIVNAAKQQ